MGQALKELKPTQHQKIGENLQVEVKEAASNEDVASSYQPVIVGRTCGGERLRLRENSRNKIDVN
jgi:hypothetical protein